MEWVQTAGPTWFRVTFEKGEDLLEGLRDFFRKECLREAYLISCIGSLERVVLAYPKNRTFPPEIGHLILEDIFEINGISGNIKIEDDQIKVHLHGSVSKAGKEVFGGAIVNGTRVFKVAELVIAGLKG